MPSPEPASTDHELIAAINAGDTTAFEAIYLRPRDWVTHLAPAEIHQLAGIVLPRAVATGESGSAPAIPVEVHEGRQPRPGPDSATLAEARPFLQIRGNQLTISAPPVQAYELQFTTDLNLDWSYLTIPINTTGSVNFVDEGALAEYG